MNILSKLRRTIINEDHIYKASDLFPIKEEIYFEPEPLKYSDRDFLKSDKIPTYYKLIGGGKKWDIKEKCVDELKRVSRNYEPVDGELTPIHLKTLNPEDIKGDDDITLNNYCKLYNIYQYSNNKDKFINDLSTVFWFMRPNEKDNRVKFHNLIRVINDAEDPEGSINILSNKIKEDITDQDGDKSNDMKKALVRLKGKQKISKENLIKILNSTKHATYTAYENSFVGPFFSKYTKIFKLKYKENSEEDSFKDILLKTYYTLYTEKGRKKSKKNPDETIDYYANQLVMSIKKLYKPKEVSKADLIANKNILDINGSIIIPKGGLVEVKMRDYTKESYLSEYFSIYKESKIDGRFKRSTMLNLYNKFISRVFDMFKELPIGDDIIKQIRIDNSGMFFGEKQLNGKNMPIFVPLDNIDLWWSETGKMDPRKEKRLTIRYQVKDLNTFYYYDRESGTMIPNTMVESYNLNEVSNLLLEGRKEDVIKKYGKDKEIEHIINYFSENDPSGNNKYLEWMVKVYLGIGKHDSGHVPTNISDMVVLFHRNLQRIKNKDINSYTFDVLAEVVLEAEEKRKEKELEKEAKKEKTVIYEDDNWLVVSPHSWKASCYYGAGTKWCVTSKDTSHHWERYSKRSSFFYVINKNLKKKDPLYKVAYRIIGRRDGYELWDAEDLEMSRQPRGKKWFEALPEELKQKAKVYHEQKFPKGVRPDWLDEDPKAQALVNYLDSEDISSSFDQWYGMPIYEIDDEVWVVGSVEEMDEALYQYYSDYTDGDLIEYYDHDGYYLSMVSEEEFINDEVEYYINDTNEDDMLEWTGLDSDWQEIEDQIEELRSQLEDLDYEKDEDKHDELDVEISDLESRQETIIDEAKEKYGDNIRDDWESCFRGGPVNCLINEKGWFGSVRELFRSGLVDLNREDLIDSITQDGDYESITSGYGWVEEMDDAGDWWYVFEIDY